MEEYDNEWAINLHTGCPYHQQNGQISLAYSATNFTLEQVTKAERGSRSIALLFH
jgi:hypothetical protein